MNNFEEILQIYGIKGTIINKTEGPLLKIIEFLPKLGTKLKDITKVSDDIKRALKVSSLHIETKENSSSLFFEYPKQNMDTIDFLNILNSDDFIKAKNKYALPINIGVTIEGQPYMADLAKMPHLLIGGTTGSGKSVGLNTFILSLISAKTPDEIKLILIDPKKIEFSIYNNQKYLLSPVVTETKDAIDILSYLAEEMDRRYEVFAETLSKNLKDYNEKNKAKKLPYLVCVIDEFADLMTTDKKVEKDVMRLAQKARAAGIHLILATQRPSVDVVTGVLKANFPSRLAYKVASATDSRTILDTTGAENLVGRGDCEFLCSDGTLKRLHGAYIEDDKIEELLKPYSCQIKPLKLNTEKKEKTKSISKSSPQKNTKTTKKTNWFKTILQFWKLIPLKYRNRLKELVIAFFIAKVNSRKNKKHR